ncbi:hypothetical protein OS121_14455 [Mycolicibacterium mucogenicum]|nr:hypothetical protein [Mycolicibacterium mucogenicum]MCX8556279.1 hypothetical protein [Mycolicibacterium mucogenicum]
MLKFVDGVHLLADQLVECFGLALEVATAIDESQWIGAANL